VPAADLGPEDASNRHLCDVPLKARTSNRSVLA